MSIAIKKSVFYDVYYDFYYLSLYEEDTTKDFLFDNKIFRCLLAKYLKYRKENNSFSTTIPFKECLYLMKLYLEHFRKIGFRCRTNSQSENHLHKFDKV